ncbi:MAG: lycopene cyclase domain-containing protein [Brevinematales bacterium]|nr:lycopene cyclase domain-containing protein [Brevinematales bacterium]
MKNLSTYLWVNLFIFLFPFVSAIILARDFFKTIPAFSLSFLIVGLFFIAWDSFFTNKKVWEFNEAHVMKFRIFNLPLEEILFFVTAPFGCIFIYSIMDNLLKESNINFNLLKYFFIFSSIFFLIAALYFRKKLYTFVVFLLTGFSTILFVISGIIFYKRFIFAMLISYLPFMIFNGILTTLPVVKYNNHHIIGIKIFNIPLEDFFYNFNMLGWYFLIFNIFSKIL